MKLALTISEFVGKTINPFSVIQFYSVAKRETLLIDELTKLKTDAGRYCALLCMLLTNIIFHIGIGDIS